MTSVTIFGKGAMGTAIADVLTAGGAMVDHIQSSDPPGPVNGDIVVLAVPHPALKIPTFMVYVPGGEPAGTAQLGE